MKFYKYHGAGNDFLIADGRHSTIEMNPDQIAAICDRHTGFGADGLMILENSKTADFSMRYYNSDGSGGMMCGNGGRCIAAFAADLGYREFRFNAPDGEHVAYVSDTGHPFSSIPRKVKLLMKDVDGAVAYPRGNVIDGPLSCDWFLDTGTRHFVRFVDDLTSCDVFGEGRKIRYDAMFAPAGVNVDFVKIVENKRIDVRTYEKGVEDETLACGTGIVASAMATFIVLSNDGSWVHDGPVTFDVGARIADLSVTFTPHGSDSPADCCFSDVWLTGPAAFIGTVETSK